MDKINTDSKPAHIASLTHEGLSYRTYAYDVMAAMVFQNIDTAAMLVYQTKPVRFELFCYVNTCFCFNTFAWLLDT